MKKLTLSILAMLAIGASAQTRYYVTEGGIATATPTGVVESAVLVSTPASSLYNLPLSYFLYPADQPALMHSRTYLMEVDTADVSDPLLLDADSDIDVILETETETVIIED